MIVFEEAEDLPSIIGIPVDPHAAVNQESDPAVIHSGKTNELMLVIDWFSTNPIPHLS